MAKNRTIKVQGSDVTLTNKGGEDYISLTDMAKKFDGDAGEYIRNWLRTNTTIQYLGVWEKVHNPDFNLVEFHQIKSELTDNRIIMSIKKWIDRTHAVGIQAKAGRYGGTYAHNEIALQFAAWLSPEFHVYLNKEFKRLKQLEAQQNKEALDWSLNRTLSKINWTIHTDAIKEELIPKRIASKSGYVYASEADILNVAMFNMTAKQWRLQNPDKKGNIRDEASTEQLLVLANLESFNAELIRMGLSQDERADRLNESAIKQMQSLLSSPSLRGLKGLGDGKPRE